MQRSTSQPARFLHWGKGGEAIFPIVLAAAFIAAYIPTYIKLINGPWRTEQEGHGPLIILASAWLAWQGRARLAAVTSSPAFISGWVALLLGLGVMVVARSQDVLMIEVATQIPVLCGCVLIVSGWGALRVLAFPLAFFIFSVPPPGWMMDALTVPLKAQVSDWVAQLLYALDYPIAQNGVMIMMGPYQLMVKDACAGMNSIFALSAIGIFYVHEFVKSSRVRAVVLLAAIVPITVAANFVRVLALVLIAYYAGIDAIEGIYHDLTGFALFGVALILFFLLDLVALAIGKLLTKRFGATAPQAPKLEMSVAPPSDVSLQSQH